MAARADLHIDASETVSRAQVASRTCKKAGTGGFKVHSTYCISVGSMSCLSVFDRAKRCIVYCIQD